MTDETPETTEGTRDNFQKYRDAFLREQMAMKGVKPDEMDSALTFVNDRLADDESNLEGVMFDLRVQMRLGGRRKYADPSMGNGSKVKPPRKDGYDVGRKLFDKIRNKPKIR
ncbi:hypothetical protein JOC34_000385 [Virgibacillus halotolerans]|uniref:hypothetical protein n=1 Tax=Virgibacillus halotolerans TaxID=1071053 RepID=UPI0019622483|nr:hypothetical protein [Virgibacillus halotolerans]MBM7598028.1 hypothetical protein [Virgibacillus halotolerans]